jgi:hypothetical protein
VPSNENGNVSSNGSSGYVLPAHRVYRTAGLSVRYAMLLSRSALRGNRAPAGHNEMRSETR